MRISQLHNLVLPTVIFIVFLTKAARKISVTRERSSYDQSMGMKGLLCRSVGRSDYGGVGGERPGRGRGGSQGDDGSGFAPAEEGAQEGGKGVEILAQDDADTLGGQGRAQVIVLVVVAVIGFQAEVARTVKEVFKLEVSDKLVGVQALVAIAEIAVEKQPVVEQPRGQGDIDLNVREIPTA